MRRASVPLWLAAVASFLVWPHLGQRAPGAWNGRPAVQEETLGAHPASRPPAAELRGEVVQGRTAAGRPDDASGAALRGGAAAMPAAGAVQPASSRAPAPRQAASQRHFPHFPTGPPPARRILA